MVTDSKKLSIIQHVLEEQDDAIIEKVEALLKTNSPASSGKGSIYDFVGIITNEEAAEMRRVIEETSGRVHPDDWK